jgi:hypothetical protein
MDVSGQLHAPAALHPGERVPGIHWIGGWVGPRAGLDAVTKREKFLPLPICAIFFIFVQRKFICKRNMPPSFGIPL